MALPNPAKFSDYALARIKPIHIALFRFLLEAYENLAFFTVLDRREALLKICFAPESREEVDAALKKIRASLPFEWEFWQK